MSVGPVLAEVLRGGRAEFNRRFAEAQHRYPGLDDQAFADYLRGPVDRMVSQVASVDTGAVVAAADSSFEIGLTLLAQRWIGPGGRAPGIVDLWLALAEHAPHLLAQAPTRILASSANAMVHWWAQGGDAGWAACIVALAKRARGADELLSAGQVAAWRAGMAHYREGALERLRSLDRELAAIAMGLALADWEEGFLQQLQRDRWFRPGAMQDRQQPCLERRAGEFVGYGGRFAEPPVVIRRGDSLILQSGTERYELHADAYGATLQPVVEAPVGAGIILPVGYRLDGAVLIGPGLRAAFDQYGQITSAACSADTLVLTHAWSHAATLVSLPQPT